MAETHRPRRSGAVKTVTSFSNPAIKDIRALHLKKHRDSSRLFLAEGLKLVADAIDAGWEIETIVYAGKARDNALVQKLAARTKAHGGLVLEVSEAILSKIARRDNPQSVLGVFRQKHTPLSAIKADGDAFWIALEGVKDPGNLGTIIRTADAAGASGVLLVGDTTDVFGIEAVRATMGSIFHVPVARAGKDEFLDWLPQWRGLVAGTHMKGTVDYRSVDWSGPVLLVMGNEQSGLPDDIADKCSVLVRIPQAGQADSLNLSVATGIMAFEIRRDSLQL